MSGMINITSLSNASDNVYIITAYNWTTTAPPLTYTFSYHPVVEPDNIIVVYQGPLSSVQTYILPVGDLTTVIVTATDIYGSTSTVSQSFVPAPITDVLVIARYIMNTTVYNSTESVNFGTQSILTLRNSTRITTSQTSTLQDYVYSMFTYSTNLTWDATAASARIKSLYNLCGSDISCGYRLQTTNLMEDLLSKLELGGSVLQDEFTDTAVNMMSMYYKSTITKRQSEDIIYRLTKVSGMISYYLTMIRSLRVCSKYSWKIEHAENKRRLAPVIFCHHTVQHNTGRS